MTRFKSLLAVLFVAVIVALVAGAPVAQAQAVSCGTFSDGPCLLHFVGAGSSAQFLSAAIAADQAALTEGHTTGIKHWTQKYAAGPPVEGAQLLDNRNSSIAQQTGNVWIVWNDGPNGTPTDIWLDVSVDSTVGVRCVLSQETNGSGCQVDILSPATTAGGGLVAAGLWPDGNFSGADQPLEADVITAINSNGPSSSYQHVNVGLTDIRQEDAENATLRLICTSRTTNTTCLGDETSPNIGGNINSSQPGSSAFAQPVGFALPGEKDPFTSIVVPTTFASLNLGAAPVVFIANNAGTAWTGTNLNLVSGVTPDLHETGQVYPLSTLWSGDDPAGCATGAVALGSQSPSVALTLFLREPLSGTMNTTEFSLFRSYDNSTNSQEGGNGDDFPMPFTGALGDCTGSVGSRSRAIGTGEVVGASGKGGIIGTNDSLGYIFTSWANLAKFKGGATYQYLTVDGVDPLFAGPTGYSVCVGGTAAGQVCGTKETECTAGGGTCTAGGSASQTVPFCSGLATGGHGLCTADLWDAYSDPNGVYTINGGVSYPNLRNGMYKAWSMYRWVTQTNTDPYGPSEVAQEAQNYVDTQQADYVPFSSCAPGTGNACLPGSPVDGLSVYRSHFKYTAFKEVCPSSTNPDNGAVTGNNGTDNGNSLGGGKECGGDVGGLIEGPFGNGVGTDYPSLCYGTWNATGKKFESGGVGGTCSKATPCEFYEVKCKAGRDTTIDQTVGDSLDITCVNSTGVEFNETAIIEELASPDVYVNIANPSGSPTFYCKIVDTNKTHTAATAPGVTNKHQ